MSRTRGNPRDRLMRWWWPWLLALPAGCFDGSGPAAEHDEQSEPRPAAAADATADATDADVAPLPVDPLADPDPLRRAEAASELGERGESEVASLARLLDDPDPRVRREAAESLADIGGVQSRIELRRALQHPDPAVRGIAEEALEDWRDDTARREQ